jgi:hypothetical protein
MSACLTHLRTVSTPYPELLGDPLDRPVLGAQLPAQLAHQPHGLGLLLIGVPIVGFPTLISFGMTPSSLQRSGASNEPRVVQSPWRHGCHAVRFGRFGQPVVVGDDALELVSEHEGRSEVDRVEGS